MGLLLELVATVIVIVTKPFSLLKLSAVLCARIIWFALQTWIELLRSAIIFHLCILWRFTIWIVALLSLPLRFFTALRREKQLVMHLYEMQAELENLVWDSSKLEEQLHLAIKERKMMEVMLAELEEEHNEAIVQIELLEGELQDLKDENRRIKEIQGKSAWSSRGHGEKEGDQMPKDTKKYGIPSCRSGYNRSGITTEESIEHEDAWDNGSKSRMQSHDFVTAGSRAGGPIDSYIPSTISKTNEFLEHQREVAVSQSLFSAVLSLIIGIIIWEANDPCMPLVLALFAVVGMSLKSVVQLFFTIKNRPASDAVVLLSFNWFMLGTLTYPILPRIARMLTPLVVSFLEKILRLCALEPGKKTEVLGVL